MRPQFQQRHYDHVWGPSQDSRLTAVTAGQLIRNIEVQIPNDAPFLMRARSYRVSYDNLDSRTQVGLQNLQMRWSGPYNDCRQTQLVPQGLQIAYGGQSAVWKPVYPQIYYPASGLMLVDVYNAGATTLTNLTLYFRGVQLFPWGVNPSPTYPASMSIIPYAYPINTVGGVANPVGSIQNLLTADTRLLQTFQVQTDSDFVIRSVQAGPSYAPFALEVFFTLRDQNRKAFSNAPVHFETLFGPSGGNYQTGIAGSIGAIGSGNSLPGIFFPEIYCPRGTVLYYDVIRADSAYPGAATIPNFPVILNGGKVYTR